MSLQSPDDNCFSKLLICVRANNGKLNGQSSTQDSESGQIDLADLMNASAMQWILVWLEAVATSHKSPISLGSLISLR